MKESDKLIQRLYRVSRVHDKKVKLAAKKSKKSESAIIRSLIDEIHNDQTKS